MSAGERREQLLDVARSLAERGFHAVSIEAVAREAGITRPIVYGHFDDLAGLLEALVDREGERALAQLAEVLPVDLGGKDFRERLVTALRAYLEAAESEPARWRLVLMPPEGAPSLLRERIVTGRRAVLAQLAGAVELGFGPDRPSPDPELTALTLSTVADESARLLLTDPARYPTERLVTHAAWALNQLAQEDRPHLRRVAGSSRSSSHGR